MRRPATVVVMRQNPASVVASADFVGWTRNLPSRVLKLETFVDQVCLNRRISSSL
jgi:hypothetical protein